MWSMYSTVAAQTWSIIFIICKLHYVAISLTLPTAKRQEDSWFANHGLQAGLTRSPQAYRFGRVKVNSYLQIAYTMSVLIF